MQTMKSGRESKAPNGSTFDEMSGTWDKKPKVSIMNYVVKLGSGEPRCCPVKATRTCSQESVPIAIAGRTREALHYNMFQLC